MEEKTETEEAVAKVLIEDAIPPKKEPRKSRKFPLVYSIWLITSICNTFLFKIVQDVYGLAMGTTMLILQLLSMFLYTWIFTILCGAPKNKTNLPWLKYFKLVLPVVISILIRIKSDNLIWTTPISDPLTAEADACFPFIVLVLYKFMLGNNEIDYWHMSLGATAGWAFIHLRESMNGRMWITEYLGYAVTVAFEMVFSKKIMQETGIHPLRLLSGLSGLVFLAILPIWIRELVLKIRYDNFVANISRPNLIPAILLHGALSSVQAASAFTILSMVPLDRYIIASSCNRITRILGAMLITTIFASGYFWLRF